MTVPTARCFLAALVMVLVLLPQTGCTTATRSVASTAARRPLVELHAAVAQSSVRRSGNELVSSSSPARQRNPGPRMGNNDAPILD